tara:strand:+ start:294 stop:500 length:207 start_codon:yes stop_codon:yes gene_type:complete
MSWSLYSREMREEIERMVEEHVKNCRRLCEKCRNKPPVEEEHKLVVKKIIKFLRYGKPKKIKKDQNKA